MIFSLILVVIFLAVIGLLFHRLSKRSGGLKALTQYQSNVIENQQLLNQLLKHKITNKEDLSTQDLQVAQQTKVNSNQK